jgi:shikimate 5-dehydrogenase
MTQYVSATKPTLYFFGVTTSKSSIMKVFPAWASHLGLKNAAIAGIDFPIHASAASYREAVAFLKNDPLSLGALVTTHKIDLYEACRDQFDEVDPHARFMGETSCLSKREGKLVSHAKDPISSGLALDGFVPERHFERTGGELFSMGAGGSTIALTWHLMQKSRGADRPSRIIVSDRSPTRLAEIRRIHRELDAGVPIDYVLASRASDNDAVVASLNSGSLVINATGLGKDAPGSPLTDRVCFPRDAIVWELNYRGSLIFLEQARAQESVRRLRIEDGWTYFLHGWMQVIAEVFHIEIPPSGAVFEAMSEIALDAARD